MAREGTMAVNVKSNASYVVELSGLALADSYRAGAKAVNEADMLNAGFLVPSGFVLTTDAFERFLAANHISLASRPEMVASAPMPPELVDALQAGVARLGTGPLAVR